MSNVTQRIFGLDLLRCIAILLVLFTHTIPLIDPVRFSKISVYTGYLGVEFFFVLSGFLIGIILLKIHFATERFTFKKIKTFWVRRWFRTLPNYYLMFFVSALAIYAVHKVNVFGELKYLSYLVFLQNSVTYQPNDFFQIAWSLSIEEWFYLSFPVLLWFISRVFKNNKSLSFLVTILLFLVVELALRFYVAAHSNNYWDEGFRKLMPLRLDGIAIGVLAAYIRFKNPGFWITGAKKMALAGVVILGLLVFYLSETYVKYFDPVTWDHHLNVGLFLKTLFFTCTSFSVALLFPFLYGLMKPGTIVSVPVTFISKISYSIYLSHLLIILVFAHVFKKFEQMPYAGIILFVTVWVATILISAAQFSYFEVKMTALRDRFGRKEDQVTI